jgi:hypothetical protein
MWTWASWVKRPGSGSSRIVKRTLTMFCGLLGVSRSFEARKRDAATLSYSLIIALPKTVGLKQYLESVLSKA